MKSQNKKLNFFSRIYDDVEESIKLVKEFESIGISAIAVHGRTKPQRPSDPVNKGLTVIKIM